MGSVYLSQERSFSIPYIEANLWTERSVCISATDTSSPDVYAPVRLAPKTKRQKDKKEKKGKKTKRQKEKKKKRQKYLPRTHYRPMFMLLSVSRQRQKDKKIKRQKDKKTKKNKKAKRQKDKNICHGHIIARCLCSCLSRA